MIKLNEIIWELTDRCMNGCDYCGSSCGAGAGSKDTQKYISIARAIAKYPPREVNISGGDPLLVSLVRHDELLTILHDAGIIVKIIVNPKSLIATPNSEYFPDRAFSIIEAYDGIGISINTEEELEIFQSLNLSLTKPVTIITNFNKSNLWLFDAISEAIKQCYTIPSWQIQLTMYKQEHPNAIYTSQRAGWILSNKIAQVIKDGISVFVADNFNNGPCGAGVSSIGILCNGDVIPCLSMLSWTTPEVQGNILKTPLQTIWESEFKDQRFRNALCCKDHCQRMCYAPNKGLPYVPDASPVIPAITELPITELPKQWPAPSIPSHPWPTDMHIMMYAVQNIPGSGYTGAISSTTEYSVTKGSGSRKPISKDQAE